MSRWTYSVFLLLFSRGKVLRISFLSRCPLGRYLRHWSPHILWAYSDGECSVRNALRSPFSLAVECVSVWTRVNKPISSPLHTKRARFLFFCGYTTPLHHCLYNDIHSICITLCMARPDFRVRSEMTKMREIQLWYGVEGSRRQTDR